ncbi:MAG: ATP-dependent Clp protease ATP-binding subunit [Clostridia bacterium]|nr:ATP-dependent Clp protease ATP-binding subunit [Clostridia bacterium]
MKLCSRCKKRIAVVFMTRLEGGESFNEGLCIQCAKELGIGPVNDMLKKMGIDDDDLERMNADMEQLAQSIGDSDADGLEDADEAEEAGEALLEAGDAEEDTEGRAPAVNPEKLFGGDSPLSGLFGMFGGNRGLDANGNGKKNGDGDKEDTGFKNQGKKNKKKKFLDAYCVDLTKRAKDGALDRVIGRERELARLIQILCRRQKNNPCLIGEPGVGKTAIAEALAQKITAGEVPFKLQNKEVHLLDLTALVAGTQFRGQFESRMKGLIEEVKALGNIILVIDEVHTIAGAGDAEGSMNAANILKPALSRGEIQVIGATTLTEYRKYIEKDAALERRFQPIIVEEPSIDDTITILSGIKNYYETFHGIKIPDEMINKTVIMSERYITDRFLPDKAIDLMDEASAYVALHAPVIDKLNRLEKTIEDNRKEYETLESAAPDANFTEEQVNAHYARLAELKSLELQQMSEFDTLSKERDNVALDVEALANVIEVWTGIPASSITQSEYERLEHLSDRLRVRIVGQDEAVDAVTRAVRRSRVGVSYKRKPVSFIFAGPTGVGKTELVKTLAAELFDTPDALIRLDMSEYMEKYAVSRMIGSPPGYVGYDDAGQLTEKIRRKPYSVILFDEIEKAHPDVMNILLQILDDGHLTDAHGREVNFENTVIVMTTNAGSMTNDNTAGFRAEEKEVAESRTEKALLSFLRPEFINRVDEIITFRSLNEDNFTEIAKIMMNDLVHALSQRDMTLVYTEAAARLIAKESYSKKYGARNMRRYIQTHVEDAIANCIIAGYRDRVTCVTIGTKTDENGKEVLSVTA